LQAIREKQWQDTVSLGTMPVATVWTLPYQQSMGVFRHCDPLALQLLAHQSTL